jgi:O-antigen/teichoic acid export membrane protein
MIGLGMIGFLFLMILTPWLVETSLRIPEPLLNETKQTFYLLAISIPIVIITTGLRGVLEAHQRFDLINFVRVPMGFFTFIGPVAVLPFSKSLVALVSVLVIGRFFACIVHVIFCFRIIPSIGQEIRIKRCMIRPLFSFGGWLTVSNIVGPMMLYMDRFFIASMISVTAVAYYTTPYEVLIKLLIIPTAILGVMFPAFTHAFAQNTLHVRYLYYQTMKHMAFILIPIVLFILFFSERALTLWINADFAHNSLHVSQILALGVFINSFGHISQSLIQASGRPDITAKLHLIQLPLYLIYLRILLSYGITGVAIAWLIRVSISTIALAYLADRTLKNNEFS